MRVPASASTDVGLGEGLTVEGWINPANVDQLGPLVEWNNGVDAWGVHSYVATTPHAGGPGGLYANVVGVDVNWRRISTAGGVVRCGVWQHVALTYDKATGLAKLYRDG